ncbi:hypothetical protein SRS16P2_00006 (plasmid) [Variovorax sp. SRS16]|uniref:hypothetical protein n=1 Tax=Variovorax sp. SRS16 TaxID=282217 RepID=UPI00131662B8|nr:hypothetical protein [Variovorax sp. SRS16]VTU45106.1 hypothetical protein SRS16P2_00006 [Variovorax sp. SRS16]
MAAVPTPQQLGHLDDEELERLAVSWRTLALRGDREANGIAHALEVERRRRMRASQLAQLPPQPLATPRPWWKFWGSPADKDRDPPWPT